MAKVYRIRFCEIIIVIGLLLIAGAALLSVIKVGTFREPTVSAAVKGRDIFVSITGANTEREPLGLPSVWPVDPGFYDDVKSNDVASINFTNSTDYFGWLFDFQKIDCTNHSPLAVGADYKQLSGNIVKAYSGRGKFKPENNIWTIAKNVTDEMDDIIPLLVTRNLDAESLLAEYDGSVDATNRMSFCSEWNTPFGNKGAVIIRKGGGMFKVRAKYATPAVIYNRQPFKATNNSKYPLKYLTPTKEVLPVGKLD